MVRGHSLDACSHSEGWRATFLWPSLVSAPVDPEPKDLVELKARYEDLGKARALLAGAEHVTTVRQVDTYFSLGEQRLKLRSVVDAKEGQLVYYERPDVGGVKESRVLLASIPDAQAVREILARVLPVKAEVRKTREIYRFQGVQVHLDAVRGLGKFIEFEKVLAAESDREAGRKQLESLRTYFQIPDDDLMASSYSDLVGSG
jgi:predicted adenylyl cyclase CyaB